MLWRAYYSQNYASLIYQGLYMIRMLQYRKDSQQKGLHSYTKTKAKPTSSKITSSRRERIYSLYIFHGLSKHILKDQLRVPFSPCKQHAPVLEVISALHTAALYRHILLLAWTNGNSFLLRKMSHYKQELVCLYIGILDSLLETQIKLTHFAFNLFFHR